MLEIFMLKYLRFFSILLCGAFVWRKYDYGFTIWNIGVLGMGVVRILATEVFILSEKSIVYFL